MTRLLRVPARRVRSSHAEVARALGTGIVSGVYRPGSKLPGDAELLERFGVSRPVLREGVKTLAAKGLLASKARVGTMVVERSGWNMFDPDVLAWHLDAGIDVAFLRELADIRMAIEPRAAALAAERRTEAAVAGMRACLYRMADEPPASAAFAEADLALHLAVAAAADNRFMRSIGAVIEAALRASFMLSAPVEPADRSRVLLKHAAIVEAIEQQNPAEAAACMLAVITNGLERHGALNDRPHRQHGS